MTMFDTFFLFCLINQINANYHFVSDFQNLQYKVKASCKRGCVANNNRHVCAVKANAITCDPFFF